MSDIHVVVGSGMAGIVASYFEAMKGNRVILIESDDRPGGLLKSDFSNNCYFDYGTHVYSETGSKDLDDFLFSGANDDNFIITNILNPGNYFNGEMNSESCYVNTLSIGEELYIQGCQEILECKDNLAKENLEDFLLQKFGVTFYENIYKPVIKKYIGIDPKLLDPQAGRFFDMSRLLAFDQKMTEKLCQSEIYNSKFGHHIREVGIKKYYPRSGGIGGMIELLIYKLKEAGVEIKLSTKINKIEQNNGQVTAVITDEETIAVSKLIWTLPCSYLSYLSKLDKKTDPPKFRNTGLYDFTFEKPLNSESTYINVYDLDMYAGRITLYQNLSKTEHYSCTVEVLTDDIVELDTLIDCIQLELLKMGLVDENNKCIFKQFRPLKNGFPIMTSEFVKKQNELNDYCESYFKNVLFAGRSSGKVFFMNDVLLDTHKKISNI